MVVMAYSLRQEMANLAMASLSQDADYTTQLQGRLARVYGKNWNKSWETKYQLWLVEADRFFKETAGELSEDERHRIIGEAYAGLDAVMKPAFKRVSYRKTQTQDDLPQRIIDGREKRRQNRGRALRVRRAMRAITADYITQEDTTEPLGYVGPDSTAEAGDPGIELEPTGTDDEGVRPLPFDQHAPQPVEESVELKTIEPYALEPESPTPFDRYTPQPPIEQPLVEDVPEPAPENEYVPPQYPSIFDGAVRPRQEPVIEEPKIEPPNPLIAAMINTNTRRYGGGPEGIIPLSACQTIPQKRYVRTFRRAAAAILIGAMGLWGWNLWAGEPSHADNDMHNESVSQLVVDDGANYQE